MSDIVERLRGVYRVAIKDGLGPVGAGEEPDNPDAFVRHFETPPIQHEAADIITALRARYEPEGEPDAREYCDHLDGQIKELLAELERKDAALRWYREQVEGYRKLGSVGDPFRHALDKDGGSIAFAALSAQKEEEA